MFVFVLDKNGKPLMPTNRCGRVKWLLRRKQAKIVCAEPFTIQLKYDTSSYLQELYVGVDVGSKHAGVSVSTKKHVVFAASVNLRDDIKKLLDERRELRSARRRRGPKRKQKDKRGQWEKTEEQFFGPSARNKIDSHIRILKFLSELLPLKTMVERCVLEIGKFDTALMKDPSLEGTDYQNGECKEFENKKAFVRHRDNYTCQYCHGKTKDVRLDVHHIIWKSKGGTDDTDNLITLCHTCHEDVHKHRIELEISEDLKKKSSMHLMHAAAMNTMRYEIFRCFKEEFPNWNIYKTTGLITSQNRNKLGIEKSHDNDAYVIAGNFTASLPDKTYTGQFFREHNRKLHKSNNIKWPEKEKCKATSEMIKMGYRKPNQGQHLIKGFAKNDRVLYRGKRGIVASMMDNGFAVIKSISTGKKIHEKHVVSMKELVFFEHGHTLMFELNRK